MINEIIKEQNESFYFKYDIEKMPTGISGLILEILYQFKDDKLHVKIDNRVKENLLTVVGYKKYNLMCDYLGIILNNALEACKESKEKLVLIEFSEKEDIIVVKVTNSFKGTINVDKIGDLNYTTKEFGHGLGIYSIISRKKIKTSFIIKNNYFISQIIINKAN